MKKCIKEENAQALVEFTLIFPILILLILGIIEFGWLINGKITLNSAAREGARVAALVNSTDADRTTKVLEVATQTAENSGLTILNSSCSVTEEDDYVEDVHNVVVVIKAEMKPIIGLYVTDKVTMSSTARMRRE